MRTRAASWPERPIARLVAVAGMLLLGGVAAGRLTVAFSPVVAVPELEVALRLPAASDLDDLARRWLVPLESAIRAAGEVRGLAGEAEASGAYLRARFRAGVDPGRKAARLESELAGLRRRLGAGGGLSVRPAGRAAGDSAAIVWLAGGAPDDLLLDRLRALPEVRSVTVAGEGRQELRARPRNAGPGSGEALAAAVERGLAGRLLGLARDGSRRLPVFVAGEGRRPLAEKTTAHLGHPVPLGAAAELALARLETPLTVHSQGRRGQVLLIAREADASPLALGRSLRRAFGALGLEGRTRTLLDEGEPLRRLLRRLALGFAAAVAVTFLAAWLLLGLRTAAWQVLAWPVAASSACYVLWLADLPLDVTTLPAVAVGLAGALTAAALGHGKGAAGAPRRLAVVLVSAAVLPVAVALAGGSLAPLLAAPAKAFLLTVTAAVPVLLAVPRPRRAAAPPGWLARPLRWALRNPWTVLLGTFAAAYLGFVLSGSALVPRAGSLAPPLSDLVVRLRFAEGTTPAQAADRVRAAETHLDAAEEVVEHWSVFDAGGGTVYATARRSDRGLARLRSLAARLQVQLAAGGASVTVRPLVGGAAGELSFGGDLEDRPEADDDATFYRLVVRHPEAAVLRAVQARIVDRLATLRYSLWHDQIHAEWGPPATRLEWVPRPGIDVREVAEGTRLIAAGGAFPAARPLPSRHEVDLRVLDPRAPASSDEVRQRGEILALRAAAAGPGGAADASRGPRSVSEVFEVREVIASPSMKRQSGRFVLPMTVPISGSSKGIRWANRDAVDRALATLPLPDGTDLDRPELNPAAWSRDRLRMLAVAAALPCLLFAVAACRLDSLGAGLAALVPPALAVLAAAPFIQAGRGHVDELTLLALVAGLAVSFPWSLEAAAATVAARSRRLAGGFAHRWLARRASGWAVTVPAAVALCVVPGLGLDGERQPWVQPLLAAGVVTASASAASFLCLPALLWAVRRQPRTAGRRRAAGSAWPAAGDLELSVRRVTKIYGGGFRALHAVSFRLEPGIVGLLGPNGAGKTTLLRLLCGLLEPTRGRVRFRGVAITPGNLPDFRRLVGYLPQEFDAYEGFTGARFLDYWAIEKGLDDPRARRREVEKRLAQVGLEEAAGRKVREYSGGMRRRIGIARALLGAPPIVIVDEPTTGLDVEARNRLRESLLAVAGERIILFSTHIASDVAAAAARILLLHRGRLLYDGAAGGLVERARGQVFETEIDDGDLRGFAARYRVTTRVRTLAGIRVRALTRGDEAPQGPTVEPNLEEAYLAAIDSAGGSASRAARSHGASLLDLSRFG